MVIVVKSCLFKSFKQKKLSNLDPTRVVADKMLIKIPQPPTTKSFQGGKKKKILRKKNLAKSLQNVWYFVLGDLVA